MASRPMSDSCSASCAATTPNPDGPITRPATRYPDTFGIELRRAATPSTRAPIKIVPSNAT